MYGQSKDNEQSGFQRPPDSDRSTGVEILLIGRNLATPMFTDEVLRHAGFRVRAITPGEAADAASENAQTYPLVVFSDTLYARDISEIGPRFRRRNPSSKLLLMLGPDSAPDNFSIFDTMMEGLEGPAALIREVRRLAGLPPADVPRGNDFARSA